MRRTIIILLFLTYVSFESNAQNENYLLQLGASDFKGETPYCGKKSPEGFENLLSFGISRRIYRTYYLDVDFQKWSDYIGNTDGGLASLSCFSLFDTTKRHYPQDQYQAHFWGFGVTKRGILAKRFEYGAGIKANYMTVSHFVIDTSWLVLRVDGATSALRWRGHEERIGALGVEFHGQIDYRLLRKTPVYIGSHGSYSLYAVLPRRISAAGIHLLFKFGGEEEKPPPTHQL